MTEKEKRRLAVRRLSDLKDQAIVMSLETMDCEDKLALYDSKTKETTNIISRGYFLYDTSFAIIKNLQVKGLQIKSNAAYLGINRALEDVDNKDTGEIPMHIRNAPVEGMESLGYHQGYLYPHDFPGHYVEQQYLPDEMLGTKYYIKDDTIE